MIRTTNEALLNELPLGEEPYTAVTEKTTAHADELANFLLLALYQVIQRIGWIFKTESIIIPAFMDYIGGGPVLRGCLPVLNRFGFAVPPVLFARRLKTAPRKKWAAVACSLAMGVPFAMLSLIWFTGYWRNADGTAHHWLPWLYLLLYGIFFIFVGMNQLADHTLQGKLIRADHRGRLLTLATVIGSPLAILAASLTMPRWLALDDGGFAWVFGVPALMFALAALTMTLVREPPDQFQEPSVGPYEHFRQAGRILADDGHFRRLAWVAILFAGGFTVFPHYQSLGQQQLGLSHGNLLLWVCVQNVATAVFSVVAGPLADRLGNRKALNVSVFGAATAPLLAMMMCYLDPDTARPIFWLVFLPIGMTPITIKLLMNYTLELADREHHPRYVSTIGICLAAPVMVAAPLVGWLIHLIGYGAVFGGVTVVLGLAGLWTFRLAEPRHW